MPGAGGLKIFWISWTLSSFPNLFYLAFRKKVQRLQQSLPEECEDQKTLIQRREDNKSVPMPQRCCRSRDISCFCFPDISEAVRFSESNDPLWYVTDRRSHMQRFHEPRPTQRFGRIFQREFLKSLLPADISVAASGIHITQWVRKGWWGSPVEHGFLWRACMSRSGYVNVKFTSTITECQGVG